MSIIDYFTIRLKLGCKLIFYFLCMHNVVVFACPFLHVLTLFLAVASIQVFNLAVVMFKLSFSFFFNNRI